LLSLLVVRADEHSCNGDRLACGGSLVYNHYAQTPGSYNATPTNGAYGPGSPQQAVASTAESSRRM